MECITVTEEDETTIIYDGCSLDDIVVTENGTDPNHWKNIRDIRRKHLLLGRGILVIEFPDNGSILRGDILIEEAKHVH